MLRFRWITFDRFKVVNLSRFYRVNFIRPYWVNFTVFSSCSSTVLQCTGRSEIDAGRYGTIPAEGVGLLHIAKNREGATGCVIFRHNESITRIADYESTANSSTDGEPF